MNAVVWVLSAFLALVASPQRAAADAPVCQRNKACKTACKGGNAAACVELGARRHGGEGIKRSASKARALYAQGCQLGDQLGCVNLAWLQLDGEGGPVALGPAIATFRSACSAGDPPSCGGLGLALAAQGGSASTEARPLLQAACAQKELRACVQFGRLLLTGEGGPADMSAAVKAFAIACDAGEGEACALQARAAMDVAPLEAKALATKACKSGFGEGCVVLGELELPDNAASALKRFDMGCGAGNAESCLAAGRLYHRGAKGVASNISKALDRLALGRDAGSSKACAELGALYAAGHGGRSSDWKALVNHRLACLAGEASSCGFTFDTARRSAAYTRASRQGGKNRGRCRRKASACLQLGDLFLTGTGGRQDPDEAAKWYHRACEKGQVGGCTRLVWMGR